MDKSEWDYYFTQVFSLIMVFLMIMIIYSVATSTEPIFSKKSTSSTYTTSEIVPYNSSIEPEEPAVVNPVYTRTPRVTITPKTPANSQVISTPHKITPKPTQISSLSPSQYRISTIISNNTQFNSTDVFVSLSFYAQSHMILTCESGYRNTTLPIFAKSDSVLYSFENTTCIPHRNAHVKYILPNGRKMNISMPMEYEMISFKLNISGD